MKSACEGFIIEPHVFCQDVPSLPSSKVASVEFELFCHFLLLAGIITLALPCFFSRTFVDAVMRPHAGLR
jgi:hypothetical protein